MISKDYIPAPPLADYINQYRLRHFVFPQGIIPACKPFPPRPEQCLSFYIRGKETVKYLSTGQVLTKPRSVISGQFSSRVDRYVSVPEFLMVIVDFKPGALYRLTKMPFVEFADCDTDAESVLGSNIKNLNTRLSSTDSYQEMISLIESFCLDLLKNQRKDYLAVDHVLDNISVNTEFNVDNLSRNSYLSTRQLERKFRERIGINPSTFLRINRFHQSYLLKIKDPTKTWFDVAINSGYNDYQHLVKSFKQFANATPKNYLLEEHNAPGRYLGLTAADIP